VPSTASMTVWARQKAGYNPVGKAKAWSSLGSNIVGTKGLSLATLEKKQSTLETTAKKAARTPRTSFVRGIGLTTRLFESLMGADPAPIEALPSAYLPIVSRHVESVAPSKNVFAQYWCPIVVEDQAGGRHVMHVDPIVVRTFRRTVAEELQHVREKRRRMLKRMRNIRQEFPQTQARDIAVRLRREIADAQGRAHERLLDDLPTATTALHVFLEVTPYMLQLGLVCHHLREELPKVAAAAGVQRISLSILCSDSCSGHAPSGHSLPTVAPFDPKDLEAWSAACDLLSSLQVPARPNSHHERTSRCGFNLAGALRWAMTAEAFDESSRPAVLLVACSKPDDLDACIGLARRSNVPLQMVGVFGLSPEDPEPGLQELSDAASVGSSLRLFFGPAYWSQFITARERQLQVAEESAGESRQDAETTAMLSSDNEIVSANVFELRLIERVMRECYSEEQQCEEELTCATRVFERKLVDREDLLAVLRGEDARPLALPPLPGFTTTPATAR